MSAIATRSVIVPHTDPGILYSGPWFQADENAYNNEYYGPALQSTLRGTNDNAVLSYVFSGTQVVLLGTSKTANTTDGRTDPSWACSIDGVRIPSQAGNSNGLNNWIFCSDYQLTDGQHNITLQVSVLNKTTFWFDHIQYAPSETVALDQALVAIEAKDPQIQYTPTGSWNLVNDITVLVVNSSSKMTFDFIGISLRWIGLISTGYPLTPTTATYSLDGASPVIFNVPALHAGSGTIFNQLFFQTPQLAPGHHRIEVIYGGNDQTAPLSLETLLIQNATTPASSGLPSASGRSNPVARPNRVPIGAVVGAVIGGGGLLIAFLFIAIRIRRRQVRVKFRSRIDAFHHSGDVHTPEKVPVTETPTAFQASPSLPNGLIQNQSHALTPPSPGLVVLADNGSSRVANLNGSVVSTEVMPRTAKLVRHEDSGVRIASGTMEGTLELPPLYSSG